jgi:Ni,Fe-hydrogenase III small subunit/ferredoxin
VSFDIAKASLLSPKVLMPVSALLGDARGSRMPDVDPARLTAAIAERATAACPTAALTLEGSRLTLDYGGCIGCGRCIEVGDGAFLLAEKLSLCGVGKKRLIRRWDVVSRNEIKHEAVEATAAANQIHALLGRALNVRQLDAGSCNGCEQEIVALNGPHYDLERFAIHFVASPKHADMLLVTGPVTRNMTEAVRQTYAATPAPKLVVAVGACGCSGGVFSGSYAISGPLDSVIPVDAYIPGCPPTPAMLLTGILAALRTRVRQER